MKSLIALESVVRLGSITKAAEELFVTHGAVSKQIAVLEEWMGRALFHQNRRQMLPTEDALVLAHAAGKAWGLINEAVSTVRDDAEVTVLKVIAPSTFAMRWLIPRVWSFSEQHEGIAIQVRQTDSLETWLDIPFDVAIRSDPTVPDHLTPTPFLTEQLFLAVSPHSPVTQALGSPGDLVDRQVLRAATRPGELEAWLGAAGLEANRFNPTTFPHFYLALEAALAGLGPLVCPAETLGDLLVKGELIEPWPEIRVPGPTYVALYDKASARASEADIFVTWLTKDRRFGAPPQAVGRTSALLPSNCDAGYMNGVRSSE